MTDINVTLKSYQSSPGENFPSDRYKKERKSRYSLSRYVSMAINSLSKLALPEWKMYFLEVNLLCFFMWKLYFSSIFRLDKVFHLHENLLQRDLGDDFSIALHI